MTEQQFEALKVGDIVDCCDGCRCVVTEVNKIDDLWWGKFREVVVVDLPEKRRKRYLYSKIVFNNLDRFNISAESNAKE